MIILCLPSSGSQPALCAERAAARDVPRDRRPIEESHQVVEKQPQAGQNDERREEKLGPKVAPGNEQRYPSPSPADVLAEQRDALAVEDLAVELMGDAEHGVADHDLDVVAQVLHPGVVP